MSEQEGAQRTLREIAVSLEKTMQCNCDLDNWEPEKNTGHSHVCRIHRRAVDMWERNRGLVWRVP